MINIIFGYDIDKTKFFSTLYPLITFGTLQTLHFAVIITEQYYILNS